MLTPHCSAVSGMVAPSSTAPITRARKSSEYGFAIHAGLLPARSLNHIRDGMGIPHRFSLLGKRSSERYEVIDGQQRINALREFHEGAFKLFEPESDGAEARFPDFIKKQPCPWG